jgi:hypothetical protein
MQLKKIVVRLDLSKRLRDLGVNQTSSIFWWSNLGRDHAGNDHWVVLYDPDFVSEGYCAAFTVGEIGALLPDWCSSSRNHDGEWEAYPSALYGEVPPVYGEKSEADARAALLIAILEKYPTYLEDRLLISSDG